MNGDQERLSQAVADHPPEEELLSYAHGELEAQAQTRIRDHLEGCARCGGLVRDLEAFPDLEPPGDAYRVGEDELRDTLGMLRARLLGAGGPTATRSRKSEEAGRVLKYSPPSSPEATRFRWWQRSAVAAALVLSLAWGFRGQLEVGRLEESLGNSEARLADAEAALRRPRANARIVTLLTTDDPLRSPDASGSFLGDAGITVILEPEELFPPETFTGEIRNLRDETVLRIGGLRPDDSGIRFYLPPGSLPTGDYRVWLWREDGTSWSTSFELSIDE